MVRGLVANQRPVSQPRAFDPHTLRRFGIRKVPAGGAKLVLKTRGTKVRCSIHLPSANAQRASSSMVERYVANVDTRVRFPSRAPCVRSIDGDVPGFQSGKVGSTPTGRSRKILTGPMTSGMVFIAMYWLFLLNPCPRGHQRLENRERIGEVCPRGIQ